MNHTLVGLLTLKTPEQRSKVDSERLRRLFLMYGSRLNHAATSPKYCYFSGFAAAAPGVLAVLRDQVLATFNLQPSQVC